MSDKEFEKYLKTADFYATQGKYVEAIEEYKKASGIDPFHPRPHQQVIMIGREAADFELVLKEYLWWVDCLMEGGRLDEAIKVIQDAMNLETSLDRRGIFTDKRGFAVQQFKEAFSRFAHEYYLRWGRLQYYKKNLDDAINFLNKGLELSPADAQARCILGLAYLDKGNEDKAKGEFQEVVRLSPDDSALAYEKLAEIYARQGKSIQNIIVFLRNAADIYLRMKQYEQAIRVYKKILEYDEGSKDVLNKLGEIYASQGDIDAAIQIYKNLATIYSQEGLFDKVIVLYEKLVEWEPSNVDIRNKVIDMYRTYLKIDPSNLRARHKLIENLIGKGSTEEAIEEFLALVSTYMEKGLLDEAVSFCQKIQELDPGNLQAIEQLAEIYLKQGDTEKASGLYQELVKRLRSLGKDEYAEEVYRKVSNLLPANQDLILSVGKGHLEKGNLDEAASEFEKVLQIDSDNLFALSCLGEVEMKRGNLTRAMELFHKILEVDSRNIQARRKLVDIYETKGDFRHMKEEIITLVPILMEKIVGG